MHNSTPIPLSDDNLPALMDKHREKIDLAVGNDSEKQQKRLELFEHDPAAMAGHYPELQKKSEELRARNEQIQKTAAVAGWGAFAAAAAATGYRAVKNKLGGNKLVDGIIVLLTSITAGFAGNALTDRILSRRTREESRDLATASRIAYERELAPYMEDTEQKLNKRIAAETQKAVTSPDTKTGAWAEGMVKKTISDAAIAGGASDSRVKAVDKSREAADMSATR